MGMFGLRQGTWYLYSKTDTKWNCSGRCMCGGFSTPAEATAKLAELKKKYGAPPKDLEVGYEKD
jgi:hypothetical protein